MSDDVGKKDMNSFSDKPAIPKKEVRVHMLSRCVSRLLIFCRGPSQTKKLGMATGFFYPYDDRLYLITNWHVVSGKNSETGKALDKNCLYPNNLNVTAFTEEKTKRAGKSTLVRTVIDEFSIELYDEDNNALWYEHPAHNEKVDVVAIPVSPPERASTCNKITDNQFRKFDLDPGMDVFVIGFPLGLTVHRVLPIWKRGSIASDPDIEEKGLPRFYVDTTTRQGMSGAPVIAEDRASGNRNFVGVYSGRIGAGDIADKEQEQDLLDKVFLAQLGIVWKAEVIEEIIKAKKRGQSSIK